ncbi:MAG: phosphotransferase [Saprospiraceae bacterium]|nr:phosphotransferase [Saprospiraceae bacterium]
MSLKEAFHALHPAVFFLDGQDLNSLYSFLKGQGRLSSDEMISSVEKPGEGNMNFVLRIITNQRTFILKQARPWVEKYPQISASVERSEVEAQYLRDTQKVEELAGFSPRLLWSDTSNFLLAEEDLGLSADYTYLYRKGEQMNPDDLIRATYYLKTVHQNPLGRFPENRAMRKLNHEHIFHFPFQKDNGLDLNSIQRGLAEVAVPFHEDDFLKKKISRLGEIYLLQGRSLIHGDFYPGSWLKTDHGIKIIDPEFAFQGPPEFDLGVMFAHMLMAQQGIDILQNIWSKYDAPANFDQGLLSAFAGVEIMRRIIGIAQLSLSLSIAEKINLMSNASEWIRKENLVTKLLI